MIWWMLREIEGCPSIRYWIFSFMNVETNVDIILLVLIVFYVYILFIISGVISPDL